MLQQPDVEVRGDYLKSYKSYIAFIACPGVFIIKSKVGQWGRQNIFLTSIIKLSGVGSLLWTDISRPAVRLQAGFLPPCFAS